MSTYTLIETHFTLPRNKHLFRQSVGVRIFGDCKAGKVNLSECGGGDAKPNDLRTSMGRRYKRRAEYRAPSLYLENHCKFEDESFSMRLISRSNDRKYL